MQLADGADLFIRELYVFDEAIRYHLNYATLAQHRYRLNCRRLALTRMSTDMLQHRSAIDA